MWPSKNILKREERTVYKFYREMGFSTMGKVKFVASNYFSIRATIIRLAKRILHQYGIKNYERIATLFVTTF